MAGPSNLYGCKGKADSETTGFARSNTKEEARRLASCVMETIPNLLLKGQPFAGAPQVVAHMVVTGTCSEVGFPARGDRRPLAHKRPVA